MSSCGINGDPNKALNAEAYLLGQKILKFDHVNDSVSRADPDAAHQAAIDKSHIRALESTKKTKVTVLSVEDIAKNDPIVQLKTMQAIRHGGRHGQKPSKSNIKKKSPSSLSTKKKEPKSEVKKVAMSREEILKSLHNDMPLITSDVVPKSVKIKLETNGKKEAETGTIEPTFVDQSDNLLILKRPHETGRVKSPLPKRHRHRSDNAIRKRYRKRSSFPSPRERRHRSPSGHHLSSRRRSPDPKALPHRRFHDLQNFSCRHSSDRHASRRLAYSRHRSPLRRLSSRRYSPERRTTSHQRFAMHRTTRRHSPNYRDVSRRRSPNYRQRSQDRSYPRHVSIPTKTSPMPKTRCSSKMPSALNDSN